MTQPPGDDRADDRADVRDAEGGTRPGPGDPRQDSLYQAILMVLAASVMIGAALTLAGELVFDNRALATAGLGLAVVTGAMYWFFRLLGRRAAQRQAQHDDENGS